MPIMYFGGYPHEAAAIGTLANGRTLYKMLYSGTGWKLVVVETLNAAGAAFARGATAPEILGADIPDKGLSLPLKHAQRSIMHPETELWREVREILKQRGDRRKAARQ